MKNTFGILAVLVFSFMQVGCDPLDVVSVLASGDRDYTLNPLFDIDCTGKDVLQDSIFVDEETKNYFPYEEVESFSMKNENGEVLVMTESKFEIDFYDRKMEKLCVNEEGNYSYAFNKVEARRRRYKGTLPNGKELTLRVSQEKEQRMVGAEYDHVNLIDRMIVAVDIDVASTGYIAFETWRSADWMEHYQEVDRDSGIELSSLDIGDRSFSNVWKAEGIYEGNSIYFAKGKGLIVLDLEDLGTFIIEE